MIKQRKMATSRVKVQKIDPNVVVLCSGYEARLIKDGDITWDEESDFPHETFCPLSAGGRLISPEERDSILCEQMFLDSDGFPLREEEKDEETMCETETVRGSESAKPWKYHNAYPRAPLPLVPLHELFARCKEWDGKTIITNLPSEYPQARREEINALLGSRQGCDMWRDSLAATSVDAFREIYDLCLGAGCKYEIDRGLCCLTQRDAFAVVEWMNKMDYCACFGRNSMSNMAYIESEKYRILVADIDAESG